MNVTITFFARARDLAGVEHAEVTLPENASVLDLKNALSAQYPQLNVIASHLYVSIDEEYATDCMAIPAESRIACFPPVSGG